MKIQIIGTVIAAGAAALCYSLFPKGAAPITAKAGDPGFGTNVQAPKTESTTNQAAPIPLYKCQIKNIWPHDRNAFTQGLLFVDGKLFESTGLNGQSSLRKVDFHTGEVLQKIDLPPQYFAEGLAIFGSNLFQLTWLNQKCFVYDVVTLQKVNEFDYQGEGWGLTSDGQSLIMSNGTDQLRFLDPKTFAVEKVLMVTAQGKPVYRLNELEFVKGEIFANIWQTEAIIRIDPTNGKVIGIIDCRGLLPIEDRDQSTDVLNGIAYEPREDRLFITGKNWPKLFEIKLVLKRP